MSIHNVPTHRQQTKAQRYSGSDWRKASAAWLRQYPFCVLCVARGKINEGAESMYVDNQRNLVVDHVTPHRGDMDLFWDQRNWQTLCRCPCHDVDKLRHERKGRTSVQWFAMLQHEIEKSGVRYDVLQLLPEHIIHGLNGGT